MAMAAFAGLVPNGHGWFRFRSGPETFAGGRGRSCRTGRDHPQ
ncbi:hypothetical protein CGRA01v4_13530 [Colletotrichum graminicola]|nr:hypothetical protein CGRA01v4_13530 [Colletotrichum graminicola]